MSKFKVGQKVVFVYSPQACRERTMNYPKHEEIVTISALGYICGCGCGLMSYRLAEYPYCKEGQNQHFTEDCLRELLEDNFGSEVAERIEQEINTKKLVEHG